MEPDRKAYYVLCELFTDLIPKALSRLLEGKMKSKLGAEYGHTLEWWKPQRSSLSRAPPAGVELATFMRKAPAEWEMNLLLKVIKYSNYELLERYETEWNALDELIETRALVFESSDTKKVPPGKKEDIFTRVVDALGKLDLVDELVAAEDLKTKSPTADEGEKLHEAIKKQESAWEVFESKLYERGKAPLPAQLESFNAANRKFNIYDEISSSFMSFGIHMLKDRTGTKVDAMRRAKLGDPVDTTKEIFRHWLQGEGIPATWDQLVKSLRHADLQVVADDIDKCLI